MEKNSCIGIYRILKNMTLFCRKNYAEFADIIKFCTF